MNTEHIGETAGTKASDDLARLADQSRDAIYHYDIATRTFTLANRIAVALFSSDGTMESVSPKNVLLHIHPEDRDKVRAAVRRSFLSESGTGETEYRFFRRDGSIRWMHDTWIVVRDRSGQATALQGFIRDNTKRKRAEEALRDSEEKYRLLVENAGEGIVIVRDGLLKFHNRKALEIVGYGVAEAAGAPFTDFVHPDDRSRVGAEIEKRMEGLGTDATTGFRAIRKDGEIVWLEANAVLITWEGRPAALCFMRDLTKEKMLQDQLRQAQKMEAIGTLAGGIAHDFNNLLSIIMGNAELAMLDLQQSDPARLKLKEIGQACGRARDIVSQILRYSRKTDRRRKPARIGPIIQESMALLRSSIPSTIDIRVHIEDLCHTVLTDPTEVNQVILNLCTNATHAMGEAGGVLEVNLDIVELDAMGAKLYRDLTTATYARLTVKDTGHGIDPHIRDRIFDPYFTTKEVGQGTGMGLALVQRIVKNIGGAVSFTSEIGRGSVFQVMLPVSSREGAPELEVKDALPRGKERVLFVDDEPGIVDVVREFLNRLGYDAVCSTNPREALDLVRRDPLRFDLVISDMTMPGMTGLSLAKEVMSICSGMPVILCTGFSRHVTEEAAKEKGIKAFIRKPVVLSDLAKTVRGVLDRDSCLFKGYRCRADELGRTGNTYK